MSFEDLPHGWPALSLADATIAADVVDLFLKMSDRVRDSALFLLCDENGRALQPVVINDVDWFATAQERARTFEFFQHLPVGGVIVAVSAGKPIEPEVAQRWLETAKGELAKYYVELIGFYTADRRDVRTHPVAA